MELLVNDPASAFGEPVSDAIVQAVQHAMSVADLSQYPPQFSILDTICFFLCPTFMSLVWFRWLTYCTAVSVSASITRAKAYLWFPRRFLANLSPEEKQLLEGGGIVLAASPV